MISNSSDMTRKRKETAPSFPEFWDAYALKRDRMAAEKAYLRLSAKDRLAAFNGIAAYREDCQQHGVRMMYAQGYLNHRRWEDEPEASAPASVPYAASPSQPSSSPTTGSQPDMEIW